MRNIRIAVISPVDYEHANAMLSGVKEVARRRLWDVVPLQDARYVELPSLIEQRRIHGIIGDLLSDRWSQPLQATHSVALVHTGEQSMLKTVSCAGFDNREAGRMAARHFLSRQYSHLYFAGTGNDDLSGQDRREGFCTQASDAGLEPQLFPPLCLTAPLTEWEAYLRRMPEPAAVFCQNDGIARRLVACCQRIGRLIPESVALLGCGNSLLDSFFAGIGISSIETDYHELGMEAANLLDILLTEQPAAPIHRKVNPKGLIMRETTGPGNLHPLVARAIDLMQHQISSCLTMRDLARQMHASRRLLELRFREYLGRSPKAELIRMRMERARELLSQPHMPIRNIAEQCGYPEISHFYTRFKQHHEGMPPAQWRERITRRESPNRLPQN